MLRLYNGNIYTMDAVQPFVNDLVIRGDEIVSIGDNQSSYNTRYQDIEEIDLAGRTVVPGFNDSHMHLLSYGINLSSVDLSEVKSMEELITKLKQYIDEHNVTEGSWVVAKGLDEQLFEDNSFPRRQDLDQVSEKHPVFIQRKCSHVSVVNTKGLQVANISSDRNEDLSDGKVYVDSQGVPTGVLAESAQKMVLEAIPAPSEADIKNYIKLAANKFLEAGLTSVQSDDLKAVPGQEEQILNAYISLAENGELPIKVNLQLQLTSTQEIDWFVQNYPSFRNNLYGSSLTCGPIKILLDGSLGGKTAALRRPYESDEENRGILTYSYQELITLFDCAHRNNFQIACHAIGDKAIDRALTAFDVVQEKYGGGLRHRLIHCQLTDSELIDRIAELGVSVDAQPQFVPSDWRIVADFIGQDRAQNTYAWKTLIDRGVRVSGSSDCPVEPFRPLLGIESSVTRQDYLEEPDGGWHPWEKVTVLDALKMYTVNPAFLTFEEKIKGRLLPGYAADLLILADDPFQVPSNQLSQIRIDQVIVNGQTV